MKVAIYSPYLDAAGGGERYIATIAEHYRPKNQVDIFWDDVAIKKKLEQQFDLNLSKVSFQPDIFKKKQSAIMRARILKGYDIFLFLSDGSIPTPFAKRNFLHFQVPFKIAGRTLGNRLKLFRYQALICNSNFTKKYIDQSFGVNCQVVYPPVDTNLIKPSNKKNYILSVGRFFSHLHSKKQEILIESFAKMIESGLKNWQLILAGSVEDKKYLNYLMVAAKGLPVKFFTNTNSQTLRMLYGQAKIYWHAAGFGEDLKAYPEKAEHFGITIAESMAAGCVPVVFAAGGVLEIVKEGEGGFLWSDLGEFREKTLNLIKNEQLWKKMSDKAQKESLKFSKEKFFKEIDKVFWTKSSG